MSKENFLNEWRAYAESMTESGKSDEDLADIITNDTRIAGVKLTGRETIWIVELIREMEEMDND